MTVTVRPRLRLPAFLLMLAAAGCVMQRPGPEGTIPGETRSVAPEAPPAKTQQILLQMAMGPRGEAYLVWMTAEKEGARWETRFSRSEDGGATWSGPLWSRKPAVGLFTQMIRLATGPAGQVYLAWREQSADKTDTRILFTRSPDGGRHWEDPPRELARGDHLDVPELQAGPDGALYVAWLAGPESRRVLAVAASQDSGGTFATAPAQIQPALSTSRFGITRPRLAAADKGRAYAVWEEATPRGWDAGIYLSRSEDHGRTWSEPSLISRPDADSRGAHAPQIAVAADGRVYLIWEQLELRTVAVSGVTETPTDRLIYFTRSLDGGLTWVSQPVRLSRPDPTSPERYQNVFAQLAAGGRGDVYVALIARQGGYARSLVALHSADFGATWSDPVDLGRTSQVKGQPVQAVLAHDGGGRVWLVWQQHAYGPRYGWFVLMNRSEDHGQQWADRAVVMGEPTVGQTTDRDLLVGADGDGRVLVAWDHGWWVSRSISLTRSVDGGKSWSPSRLPLD